MYTPRIPLLNAVVLLLITISNVVALTTATTPNRPIKVLVTGAGGKTGRIVLQKLLKRPGYFDPKGMVRTEVSKQNLISEMGIPESNIVVADICDPSSIEECCRDMEGVIICTSATPVPSGMGDNGRPIFGFPNGHPKEVDWIGQKNQIDATKKTGADGAHVVICSSMGGTDPSNMLNGIGKSEEDPSKGNILLWKRKAEKYLMDSGLTYTIIHPGGLVDDKGGVREVVVGVDDRKEGTENRNIPRADVAELLVASLEHESFRNRSFDARTKPEEEGDVTQDYGQLLKDLKGDCDYTLGRIA